VLKGEFFAGIVRAVVRRPILTLLVVGALALAGALLAAVTLRPSTAIDTLVDPGSDTYAQTEAARQAFGDDPVVILVKDDLQQLLLGPDLLRLADMEDCIAATPAASPSVKLPPECAALAKLKPAKVVYGPGTFISRSADELSSNLGSQIQQQQQVAAQRADAARRAAAKQGLSEDEQNAAAQQAQAQVQQAFQQQLMALGMKYGITSPPAIDNPQFVAQLVFDGGQPANGPKAKFSALFPSPNSAVVQIRLRPDLTQEERGQAIDLIRRAAADPLFKPQTGDGLVVTGVPVVVDSLADAVQRQLLVLLIAAALVMAATLALVFRSPLRLLPLVLALAAAGVTFGALAALGAGLTMASVAALPVLIGLAVDYAIQFQSRFNEHRVGDPAATPDVAATAAAAAGAPTIASAGLATAVGFMALLLSPVPMVRGFGLIVVGGVAVALGCALTAGFAALARFSDAPSRPDDVPPLMPRARETAHRISSRVSGIPPIAAARVRLRGAGARITGWWRSTLSAVLANPRRTLAVAVALAAMGWAADTQLHVVSDLRELVPQNLQALRDVNELQDATGVSGELDVTVHGDDVTDPAVVSWMADFQQQVLDAHGYQEGDVCNADAGAPELCPALSLPDLLGGVAQDRASVDALLAAVPPYFLQSVLSPDRKTANLAFGIRLMPLDRQQQVINEVRSKLHPPVGVTAAVTGLPVLAAQGNADLSAPWRRLLVLVAGLLAVFLTLLAVRRSVRQAAVPLIPIALATGWASLILFVLGIPLNPMSAALGAVVIAISTEFSVLLSARYRQERLGGLEPRQALERAYGSTGAAVFASGITATAGFAVLIASDIRMLSDFGLVTVVGLGVSLLGVMLALPAALVWADD
jgi:hydrophobe/amphiphile efflux-3 (HAE3) family protein